MISRSRGFPRSADRLSSRRVSSSRNTAIVATRTEASRKGKLMLKTHTTAIILPKCTIDIHGRPEERDHESEEQ